MRLIDADRLLKDIEECVVFTESGVYPSAEIRGANKIIDRIKAAPTVDAAPVVHGRWAYYSSTMMECSNCKRHTARHKFKYCPHCGAVMEDKYYDSLD